MSQLGESVLEILIVLSPQSSTESKKVCHELASAHHRVKVQLQTTHPGLGNAVRQGLKWASGNLVLMMDSDGEMENGTVLSMLETMATTSCAAVVASRWMPAGGFEGYDKRKLLLNWCFQQTFRLLYRTPISDLTYGFKLMRGDLARSIEWKGTLHEIACETTLKPIRLGVPVQMVPTRWVSRAQGSSKNTFWRNFRYVRMAIDIWVNGVTLRSSAEAAHTGDRKLVSASRPAIRSGTSVAARKDPL